MSEVLHDDPNIETVTIALNYVCNNRCRFCFIERELDLRLPDTSDEFITHVFEENVRRGLFKRLILAGAEATLRRDLPDVARRALAEGGFESVRLQTNGRRLRDAAYLKTLIDAGITEYFVSIHAGTAELDAELTRAPKNFDQMRAGVRNCLDAGVRVISNTAVTRSNHRGLVDLADFLIAEQIPESHFWAFIEFGNIGQGDEHVPYGESMPFLHEAVSRLRAADRKVVLSWFPECLLAEHAELVVNHRDNTLIHDEFSQRVKRSLGFSCPHQSVCPKFGDTCIGFHERYVENLGYAPDVRPLVD